MTSFQALMRSPPNGWLRAAAIVLISLSMLLGVTRMRDKTEDATYRDRGDAYSEHIVRNTVINDIAGKEHTGGSLIWTKGYEDPNLKTNPHRYDYAPDGTKRYYSNRGAQAAFYTGIARIGPATFLAHSDAYFEVFRFVNCLMLTVCLAGFFAFTLGTGWKPLAAAAVMSVSSGVALFGANLYFFYWLMFLPLLAAPLLTGRDERLYIAAAFVGGLANFAVHYEFATTFTLMWVLPVILTRYDRVMAMLRLGALVFAAVCASFAIDIVLHLLSVMAIEQVDMAHASALVFEKLKMRVASLDNHVPPPFTLGFVKSVLYRWSDPAFHIEDIVSVSRFVVLVVFAALCLRDRSTAWRLAAGWAVATYASWYVLAYQHSMQHYAYDAMLFTCTVALVTVLRLFARRLREPWVPIQR